MQTEYRYMTEYAVLRVKTHMKENNWFTCQAKFCIIAAIQLTSKLSLCAIK